MFFMSKVDFRTVNTKTLRNPRDRAPLSDTYPSFFFAPQLFCVLFHQQRETNSNRLSRIALLRATPCNRFQEIRDI